MSSTSLCPIISRWRVLCYISYRCHDAQRLPRHARLFLRCFGSAVPRSRPTPLLKRRSRRPVLLVCFRGVFDAPRHVHTATARVSVSSSSLTASSTASSTSASMNPKPSSTGDSTAERTPRAKTRPTPRRRRRPRRMRRRRRWRATRLGSCLSLFRMPMLFWGVRGRRTHVGATDRSRWAAPARTRPPSPREARRPLPAPPSPPSPPPSPRPTFPFRLRSRPTRGFQSARIHERSYPFSNGSRTDLGRSERRARVRCS